VYVLLGGEARPEEPLNRGGVSLRVLCEEEDGGVLGRVEVEDKDLRVDI
jgi:hypothetical protein